MRIALAKVLIQNPEVLLMDEPTNHLDLESIVWLEEWLMQFPGALFMTSHDRDFMNRIVKRIVEVAQKKIHSYTGNYDFYERERQIRLDQLVASASRQQDMLAKEKEFIARFAARASHAAQVQSRVKKLEKIDIIEVPSEERVMAFEWPEPPRGGDDVVRVTNLGVTFTQPVFQGANAVVKRMDRVAVVGVNGAGKSSFMRVVVGDLEPSVGEARIGPSIELGYFSQNSLDVLNPRATVFEEVQNRIPHSTIGFIRNLLGAFRFSGDDVEKKVGVLSGGEKSRLVLATILARPVNFLVLDEPTNHLDIRSREVLLDAVKRFPGTVMIVSHDRHFLQEVTTRVFEIDRHKLTVYDMRWNEYLRKRGEIFVRK
jgi:ATP-binding cassette subfamily F protein 3